MARISGANLQGAFPVLDTSRSVGTYTANLQRQAAQRQAEQKALSDDVNKIKIDGLRDADKPDYFQGFESWRTTAQNALKERDFRKKAELQSQADRQYLELQDLVGKSKEYNKIHNDVSTKMLDNRFRDQLTDDAVTRWQQSAKLPLSSPNIVKDPSTLSRQLDTQKIVGDLTKIDEDLLKLAKYSNPQVRNTKIGNRNATESIYSRTVDPAQQALQYGLKYDTDRNFRAFVQQQYADVFNQMGDDEAKAAAIQDLVKQRPVSRQEAPKIQFNDNWREKADYHDALIRARKRDGVTGGKEEQATFWQDTTNRILNEEPGSGEFLTDAIVSNVSKNNQTLNGKIQYNKNNNTGERTITIPPIIKNTVKVVDGKDKITTEVIKNEQKFTYNPQDREGAARKITDLLNIYTGEKEPYRKQFTAQGKGKVASGQGSEGLKSEPKMVTMILPNGQSGQVPSDKVDAFLKKYPKAKKQ